MLLFTFDQADKLPLKFSANTVTGLIDVVPKLTALPAQMDAAEVVTVNTGTAGEAVITADPCEVHPLASVPTTV